MNNVWNYVLIVVVFIGIFGTISMFGKQALTSNPDLDSESISKITGLDSRLYSEFDVNTSTGEVTGVKVDTSLASAEGADPNERESTEAKINLGKVEDITGTTANIPKQVIGGVWFFDLQDWALYLTLLGSVISVGLFIAGYLFFRTGKADNRS